MCLAHVICRSFSSASFFSEQWMCFPRFCRWSSHMTPSCTVTTAWRGQSSRVMSSTASVLASMKIVDFIALRTFPVGKGLFFMSLVTAGHEIKSEASVYKNGDSMYRFCCLCHSLHTWSRFLIYEQSSRTLFGNSVGEQYLQTLSFLIQEQVSENCPKFCLDD